MIKITAPGWAQHLNKLVKEFFDTPITKAPYVAIPLEEWINIQNTLAEFERNRLATLRQHESDSRNVTVIVDGLKEILHERDFQEKVLKIPKKVRGAKRFAWFFEPRKTIIRTRVTIESLEDMVDRLDGLVEFGRRLPILAERLPIITQRSKA